jgi:hypothetical protein
LTQIGTDGGGVDLVAQVVVAGRLLLDLDTRAHGPQPEPGPEELVVAALAGPQVERAQRGPAGQVGEVGGLVDAFGALRDQRRLDLASTLGDAPVELFHLALVLLPTRLPAPQLVEDHHRRREGDRHQHVRAPGEREQGQPHDDRGDDGRGRHPRLLRTGREAAEGGERAVVDHHRLVRRAPERDLAQLVALGVGRAAEDPQRDRGGAELDDVVAADERRSVDRPAVHGERVGRARVGDELHREIREHGDRELVARHRGVVEVDGAVGPPTHVVGAGFEHERAPGFGAGGHVAADRLSAPRGVAELGAVDLEAQRVTRDDTALEDRRIEREPVAGALDVDRLARFPRGGAERAGGGEEIGDAVVRLHVAPEVGRGRVSPPDPDQELHRDILIRGPGGLTCVEGGDWSPSTMGTLPRTLDPVGSRRR